MTGQYGIKEGYQHGTLNTTLEDEAGDYWDAKRLLFSRHLQYAAYAEAGTLIKAQGLKTVLDVGCGVGHKLMECVVPAAERVVGVEQPTAVKAAHNFFPDLELVSADLEHPDDSKLGKFDLLMSVDVIEHLLDPDMLLTFLLRHSHEGSHLLLSTPERDIRRGPGNMKSPKKAHVREWNQAEFRAYLESRGLVVRRQLICPAFRMGWSRLMLRERVRMIRKRIPLCYSQVALCTPAP